MGALYRDPGTTNRDTLVKLAYFWSIGTSKRSPGPFEPADAVVEPALALPANLLGGRSDPLRPVFALARLTAQ